MSWREASQPLGPDKCSRAGGPDANALPGSREPSIASDAGSARSAITITGLVRRYGNVEALGGIDLRVPRGCIFSLLGPNGAGKSTLLRILAGLLRPTTGRVTVEGRDAHRDDRRVKEFTGVVLDDLALFARLTAWEHMTLAGAAHGLSANESSKRAEELLRAIGLWDKRYGFAADLSYGSQKKLALAVALIHSPHVLILDEPFAGLDPMVSRLISVLFERLAASGATVVFSSHVLEVVSRVAHRVALLDEGKILFEGSVDALREDGRTLESVYVRAFGQRHEAPDLSWLA